MHLYTQERGTAGMRINCPGERGRNGILGGGAYSRLSSWSGQLEVYLEHKLCVGTELGLRWSRAFTSGPDRRRNRWLMSTGWSRTKATAGLLKGRQHGHREGSLSTFCRWIHLFNYHENITSFPIALVEQIYGDFRLVSSIFSLWHYAFGRDWLMNQLVFYQMF